MSRSLIVGLDLGTTNCTCSVAVRAEADFQGIIESLPIQQLLGDPEQSSCYGTENILPSVVGIDRVGALYTGFGAKIATPELLSRGYTIIRDVKRQLGNPSWQISVGDRFLRPKHFSALLLATIRRSLLHAYPDASLHRLVLTIPASFSSLMRCETLEAAELAGFDPGCIELLDEPVAALLSKLSGEMQEFALPWPDKSILVFDMGGGTLDASILSLSQETHTVDIHATSRYHDFAGNDIDLELAALVLSRVRSHADYTAFLEDNTPNHNSSRRSFQIGLGLMSIGEQLKLRLSHLLQAGPQIGGLERKLAHFRSSGEVLTADLTFEFDRGLKPESVRFSVAELIEHLAPFMRPGGSRDRDIFVPVAQVLERASIASPQVVCLAGAASYFPLVRDAIAGYFAQPPEMLDPVYAVSSGAVVWSLLKLSHSWQIRESLRDSIFLKRRGHAFLEIFSHPVPIPSAVQTKRFSAEESPYFSDDRGRIRLEFFQGESSHDPRLALCQVEDLMLERQLSENARLVEVRGRIDANKVFHFDLLLEDRAGQVPASVSFSPGTVGIAVGQPGTRPLEGLLLNGSSI